MKARRHARIMELISQYYINTQEELLIRLRESGFETTQATISRDIKELKLLKVLTPDGRYRYAARNRDDADTDFSSKFNAIFAETVRAVDYAGNIVVVKCYTGTANAACMTLDALDWENVVGTIAGDDTIFIAVRTQESAKALVAKLNLILKG